MIEIKKYEQTIILDDVDNKSGYVLYCNGLEENNFLQYRHELSDIIEEKFGFSDKLKEYFLKQIEVRNFRLVREFARYDRELALVQASIMTKDGNYCQTQLYILDELKQVLKYKVDGRYIVFNHRNGDLVYLPVGEIARISILSNSQ